MDRYELHSLNRLCITLGNIILDIAFGKIRSICKWGQRVDEGILQRKEEWPYQYKQIFINSLVAPILECKKF